MIRNGALACASLLICWLALEAAVRVLPAESDGFGHTRSARRWLAAHWHPVNTLGYRDAEPAPQDDPALRRLFVAGDSFVAGHGIERVDDRFANQLATSLGDDWALSVVARNGWSTRGQLVGLEAYPSTPDALVLGYTLNDVEDAAEDHGLRFTLDLSVRPGWLAPVVAHSALADLVYWRIARLRLGDAGLRYRDFLDAAYADEAVWRTHVAELEGIRAYAEQHDARLAVVLFPHLADPGASEHAYDRVGAWLAANAVPTLDVAALLAASDWPPADRVVNSVDAHPSVALHRCVARELVSWARNGAPLPTPPPPCPRAPLPPPPAGEPATPPPSP